MRRAAAGKRLFLTSFSGLLCGCSLWFCRNYYPAFICPASFICFTLEEEKKKKRTNILKALMCLGLGSFLASECSCRTCAHVSESTHTTQTHTQSVFLSSMKNSWDLKQDMDLSLKSNSDSWRYGLYSRVIFTFELLDYFVAFYIFIVAVIFY